MLLKESRNEKNAKIAKNKLIINQKNLTLITFYFTEMKTNKSLGKSSVSVYEEGGKSKKLAPEKKRKSNKRAFIEELEEDEELEDIFDFKEKESIEDYFDEDEDFDDDEE